MKNVSETLDSLIGSCVEIVFKHSHSEKPWRGILYRGSATPYLLITGSRNVIRFYKSNVRSVKDINDMV